MEQNAQDKPAGGKVRIYRLFDIRISLMYSCDGDLEILAR